MGVSFLCDDKWEKFEVEVVPLAVRENFISLNI